MHPRTDVSDLRVRVVLEQLRANGYDVTTATRDRVYRVRPDGTYDAVTLRDAVRSVHGRGSR
ncbi:hypothetical protein Cch01nite_31810 [Cellulomonas chitinilytica]|uniref:Uncharacterized protein n=1 Tax=Cellulomonas chitinilytica TaxID=398759 RepID=A0A919P5E5_9CELL|nr:hypothetical protein Cch01nite_31810 [Cellulomonas chitinilytica]